MASPDFDSLHILGRRDTFGVSFDSDKNHDTKDKKKAVVL